MNEKIPCFNVSPFQMFQCVSFLVSLQRFSFRIVSVLVKLKTFRIKLKFISKNLLSVQHKSHLKNTATLKLGADSSHLSGRTSQKQLKTSKNFLKQLILFEWQKKREFFSIKRRTNRKNA